MSDLQTICDEIMALIPAYSVGATDPDETILVEANLNNCPEARIALAEYRALGQALLRMNFEVEGLPAEIDLMPSLKPVTLLKPAHPPRPAAPVVPVASGPGARHFREVLRETRTTPAVRPAGAGRGWAMAALLALFVLTNGFWWLTFQQTRTERDQALASQTQLLAQLADPTAPTPVALLASDVHHRALDVTEDGVPGSNAFIVWDADTEIGTLFVTGLPPLATDRGYQLWLVRTDHSLSLGLFRVDEQGIGTLMFQSPEPIEAFEAVGISTEPASGSTEPTTPHLVIGRI